MVKALVEAIEKRWGEVTNRIGGRPVQGGYLDGLELGFRVHEMSMENAPDKLVKRVGMRRAAVPAQIPLIIKTHDISSRDLDALADRIENIRFILVHRDFKDVTISRYFYYRYFWPSNPDLGRMPNHLEEVFSPISYLADRDALKALIEGPLIQNWVSEWAAFETPFSTPKALRVSFTDMLDGSAFASVSDFLQFKVMPGPSIEKRRLENEDSGRQRFYRRGASEEWREWFAPSDVALLDGLASSAVLEHCRIPCLVSSQ
jgi:hypothetical protein